MITDDDDELDSDLENPDKPKEKQFVVRLDPEHYEALGRIAKAERLKKQDAMRRLIRFADQLVSGPDSPFSVNLERPLTRKVG